jgi:glycosyltransferase involved in cell wall biosynthesis
MSNNKKFIFDARHISNEFSGLGRYSMHLLEGLFEHSNQLSSLVIFVESSICSTNSLYQRLNVLVRDCDIAVVVPIAVKVFSIQHYFNMRGQLKNYPEHEYFYPHFDVPFGIKNHTQFVIHDLFPLIIKGYIVKNVLLKKMIFYLLCFHSLTSKGKQCVAISQSTRSDIKQYFPLVSEHKVRTVHSSGCLYYDKQQVVPDGIDGRYLFYIGDRRPHKNLKKMIDIFCLLKVKYHYRGRFIIAGSTKNFDVDIDAYVADKPDVELVGPISDEQLLSYYRGMESLFFLSKYEGFGLPVLEAATLNKKIITSNISSLPEVTPDSGLLLDSNADLEPLTQKISEYLDSKKEISNESFVSAFSWHRTALKIFIDKQV